MLDIFNIDIYCQVAQYLGDSTFTSIVMYVNHLNATFCATSQYVIVISVYIRYIIWVFPKIMIPPNHPNLIGFSIINHPFWGTPIFGNTHIYQYVNKKVDGYTLCHPLDGAWANDRPRWGFSPQQKCGNFRARKT